MYFSPFWNKVFAGVSIKFEVGSSLEYQQSLKEIFNLGKIVAMVL